MSLIFALGPAGTNGHEAALRVLDRMHQNQPPLIRLAASHAAVFAEAIMQRGLAVVPVENSTADYVSDTLIDFWLAHDVPPLQIIGELSLPIRHSLLARQAMELEDIQAVYSHPQALRQCAQHLADRKLTKTAHTESTAAAAALLKNGTKELRWSAALASPFAAMVYNLATVESDMEDSRDNATRFHVLGHSTPHPTGADRTAVLLFAPNEQGTLHRVTGAFADEGVNMSSIHSIPLGRLGAYAFYIEFDEHQHSPKGVRIMLHLHRATTEMRILGSYPQEKQAGPETSTRSESSA